MVDDNEALTKLTVVIECGECGEQKIFLYQVKACIGVLSADRVSTVVVRLNYEKLSVRDRIEAIVLSIPFHITP